MARALQLAERGLYTTDPNPRVGCVLVRNGEVLGEGWHERAGGPHAEINALAATGEYAPGATAYVTLEPCCHFGRTPPCTEALLRAGVRRVVAAMEDPDPRVGGRGLQRLREAGVEVACGLMAAQARALNPGFVGRMAAGRPWVRLKMAASLDGRTAMASGESRWITGPEARADGHRLRARSSVVLTGVGTVLADDPSLTVRLPSPPPGGWRQPRPVILDPDWRTPPTARVLQGPAPAVVVGVPHPTGEAARRADALAAAGAELRHLPGDRDGLDLGGLPALLTALEANEVHVEAGATLAGALLAARLVDELVVYLAPTLLGDGARGLFHLPGLERMEQRLDLQIRDLRPVGRDWRIAAIPEYR